MSRRPRGHGGAARVVLDHDSGSKGRRIASSALDSAHPEQCLSVFPSQLSSAVSVKEMFYLS